MTLFQKKTNLDVLIFDLDETLIDWRHNKLFPRVAYYLDQLKACGYILAIASYNSNAEYYLDHYGIKHLFDIIEYTSVSRSPILQSNRNNVLVPNNIFFHQDNKYEMLKNIISKTQKPSSRMLFFDDQKRFVQTAESIGIKGIVVSCNGLVLRNIKKGLSYFD
jgi:HAD superfamily phosphatase (TIGR01681 family)